MKTKTIWMLAILFGILATGIFYFAVMPGDAPAVKPASDPKAAAEAESQPKKATRIAIRPKMRAISVPVNEGQGVSGHIQAGDFVDIIVTSPPNMVPPSGQLLLQNVKVLALGNAAVPSAENTPLKDYRMVTLEVASSEGVSLGLAVQNQAAIYLMLRPPEDPSTVGPVNILLEKLIREGVPK